MIIMEGIVTVITTSLCKISNASFKFFSTHSKSPDVPMFRSNLYIEDDSRAKRCHFTVKPARESFVMEVFHRTVGNPLCYLSNMVIHSAVNII